MKAAYCTGYGPPEQVLEIRDVDPPTPGEGEIRVRVRASTVAAGDYRVRSASAPAGMGLFIRLAMGITRPRKPVLGMTFAGVVDAVGPGVPSFRPGQDVFGGTGAAFGCHAELVVVPADGTVTAMPKGIDYDGAAASLFGPNTALYFLRKAGVGEGQRVLVYGASGAVGSATVQLARHRGARVTGVCSTKNVELVRSLGAEKVIDYTTEDPFAADEPYDVVVECVGKTSYGDWKASLREGGTYVMIAGGLPDYLTMLRVNLAGHHAVVGGVAAETVEDLHTIRELLTSGGLRPVIDSRYPLSDVARAHARADSGRKVGAVVLTMETPGD